MSVAEIISPGTPQYLQQEFPHLQPFDLEVVREESLEYGDGDSAASATKLDDIWRWYSMVCKVAVTVQSFIVGRKVRRLNVATCKGRQCMLHMHLDGSFGLAYTDQKELFGGTLKERKAEWKSPTLDEVKRDALHIEKCAKPKSKYDLLNALNDNNNGN